MCGVLPRHLGKGAVPAPVASPQPWRSTPIEGASRQRTVWPVHHHSGCLRAPRDPMAKGRACPLEPSLSRGANRPPVGCAPPFRGWITTKGVCRPWNPASGAFASLNHDQGRCCSPLDPIDHGACLPPGPQPLPRGRPSVGLMNLWGVHSTDLRSTSGREYLLY